MSGPPPDGIQWPRRSTVRVGGRTYVGLSAWLIGLPRAFAGAVREYFIKGAGDGRAPR